MATLVNALRQHMAELDPAFAHQALDMQMALLPELTGDAGHAMLGHLLTLGPPHDRNAIRAAVHAHLAQITQPKDRAIGRLMAFETATADEHMTEYAHLLQALVDLPPELAALQSSALAAAEQVSLTEVPRGGEAVALAILSTDPDHARIVRGLTMYAAHLAQTKDPADTSPTLDPTLWHAMMAQLPDPDLLPQLFAQSAPIREHLSKLSDDVLLAQAARIFPEGPDDFEAVI
jgi:hypothetical protein